MSTTPSIPNRRRRLLWSIGLIAAAAATFNWRGHVGCYLFYAECNPLLSVPEMPNWNVPTNPVEKAGYDFAHSLELPEGVPEPVPFDFKAASVKAIEANLLPFEIHQHVAQQYFDHLCSTEAGVTVFDTVENVEGVLMLRSERVKFGGAWDHDRYGTEIVNSFGNFLTTDDFGGGFRGAPEEFIQPYGGRYTYLDVPNADVPGSYWQFSRQINANPPYGYSNGVSTRTPDGSAVSLPFMVVRSTVPKSEAKYAITWRGLRRSRDREFAIAGAEMIALEVGTNRIIAVNRDFRLSGRDIRPSGVWWGNAKSCRERKNPQLTFYAHVLARLVFKPISSVNDDVVVASSSQN